MQAQGVLESNDQVRIDG